MVVWACKLLHTPVHLTCRFRTATRLPAFLEGRSQFEVDFVCLSYCNSEADIYDCRALLDSVGMAQTKVGWRDPGCQHFAPRRPLSVCYARLPPDTINPSR